MDVRDPSRARKAIIAVCAVSAFLQLALAPHISILGGTVNFMVVLALTTAPAFDVRSAVLIGFFAGLFYDLTSPVPVGLMSLVLTVACFAESTFSHGLGGDFSADSLRLILSAVVLVNMGYAVALFALGVETSLLEALLGHGLTCSVLDGLVVVPFLLFGSVSESKKGFSARSKGGRLKPYKSLK
ncbi:MAG: rod shape-determining protein MreD [Coriobacteriaceae bacterium]|nr:rod shape-determining protein MreD [Coriobacteriaceae bacterium]